MGAIYFGIRLLNPVSARETLMSIIFIFVTGFFVSALTFAAALLVGLHEASDPSQSRLEDLTKLEKKIVGR